ncbi:hypothetical protein HPP92_010304 [Vanilla planifolia]|uniref:tRNA (guanine(46)-N(7))-methyltransferase n=1 Tax=Vanilla planifolia TaxID=51239 RepID=A0A835QYC1_VANPL|nr:hypothetical protein HPP92_010304 [Vanilla planifolia]
MSMKDSKTTGGNGQSVRLPRKRFYRARAHSNPLSDSHFPIPISPSDIDYSPHYPRFFDSKHDEHDKETLMIGMELRDKVTEYVKERILALRASNPGQYDNISVVRTKSMKYLPNYFCKGQLSKMFFLFPHPHFKEKNHRRRVCLCPGSWRPYLYNNTDVEELGDWIKSCMESHPSSLQSQMKNWKPTRWCPYCLVRRRMVRRLREMVVGLFVPFIAGYLLGTNLILSVSSSIPRSLLCYFCFVFR